MPASSQCETSRICGVGWVTPLGADLDAVWARLAQGHTAEPKVVANPETGREHLYAPVPPKTVESLGRNPRLRRSSAISYFAVAAGLAALENAGVTLTPESAMRTAIVFAICSGGVIYTRKFYEQIVKQGANAASPLLFPETVYNAPASPLAAQLGIDGASYTLVSDSTVGFDALHFAGQLLADRNLDRVVVVGAEECDWILCEAYRAWRFSRQPGGTRGALLAEGAAAVVLGREGDLEVRTHPGAPAFRQVAGDEVLRKIHDDVAGGDRVDLVIGGANGTFVDAVESRVLTEQFSATEVYRPKLAFGETLGAAALIQVVVAALALRQGGSPGAMGKALQSALATALGFNQQAAAALVRKVDGGR